MFTETEAKKKVCPTMSADSSLESYSHCMGSECMAWRWCGQVKTGAPIKEEEIKVGEKPPEAPAGCTWVPSSQHKPGETRTWGLFEKVGYCGLAGTP